ncbi:MAG TPA: hypothetical protein VKA10_07800 [Prolixibacteraceae bacterium]|nr:hypothetical protein [Prolixibacteraceae bacterium]
MKLIFLFLVLAWLFLGGNPAQDAVFILENNRNNEQVFWQRTGENGKVSMQHLDEGNYRLVIEFPQLDGKWLREKKRHEVMTKATYNPKKRTYYYQGDEGFFSVKFSRIKRIESEKAVFQEIRLEDRNEYVIARFETSKMGAKISMQVKKLTSAQFKRAVEKIEEPDISTLSIPKY